MVNFKEIYQGSRGGPTFSRGGPTFSRGSNCLFPIETHITCNFPGGGGGGGAWTPCPQHVHSYFCLGVHVPPDVSIWGYMFICEGTHILELFFIVNV